LGGATRRSALAGGASYHPRRAGRSRPAPMAPVGGASERRQILWTDHVELRVNDDLGGTSALPFSQTRDWSRTSTRLASRSTDSARVPAAVERPVNGMARYNPARRVRTVAAVGQPRVGPSWTCSPPGDDRPERGRSVERKGRGAAMREQPNAAAEARTGRRVVNASATAVHGPLRLASSIACSPAEAHDRRLGWLNELTWTDPAHAGGHGLQLHGLLRQRVLEERLLRAGWFVRAQGRY